MKTNRTHTISLTGAGKRDAHYSAFYKKDSIIKNIEIIVACVTAFIAGIGLYELFY